MNRNTEVPQPTLVAKDKVVVIAQRRGEECITTIAGFDGDLDPLCKGLKKKLNCNGCVKTSPKVGDIIQLTGDLRATVKYLLDKKGLCRSNNIITYEAANRSGVVTHSSSVEGSGSIRPDDGGTEVFVHSEVLQDLNIRSSAEERKVEFCTELDDQFKLWAIDVRGVDGNSACKLPTRRGVVVRFDPEKGYGFIEPNDGGCEVFVHQTAIQAKGFRSLAAGEHVEFQAEADETHRRLKAVKVTGLDGKDLPPGRLGQPSTEKVDWKKQRRQKR